MKRTYTYRIVITTAWWWGWLYVPAVMTLVLMGGTPDWNKVERVAAFALRLRLVLVETGRVEA